MAKPISSRRLPSMQLPSEASKIQVLEPAYWSPPKGLMLTNRLSRVPLEYCADIKNMVLDNMTLRSRFGTTLFASIVNNTMAVVGFVGPDQLGHLIRLTNTSLERWNGSGWTTIASPFTGTTTDYWTFTNWGEWLLMCNGVNKIYQYNPVTGEHGFIDESVPAKHIATFGGRVVATYTNDGTPKPYRQQWSVRNDSEDWNGEGSGFEDLYGAAGGRVDLAHGCYPITDDTALVIREHSIWQVSTTGQALAPFRYSRLTSEIGTRCRRAIAEVPGGYVIITRDNIVVFGLGQMMPIGDPVREALIGSITDYDAVVGKYDVTRNEYRVAIGNTVWRYSFREGGWTKDVYPNTIRDMTRVNIQKFGKTIDELVGTIDAQTGTINDLVNQTSVEGFFLVEYSGASTLLAREDGFYTTDVSIATAPAGVAAEVVLATALLQAGSVLEKTKVIEVQLEYESIGVQPLVFEYSTNGGVSWTQYSNIVVGTTAGPQILAVRKTLTGHNLQLRVRSDELGRLRALSMTARVVEEAKVRP